MPRSRCCACAAGYTTDAAGGWCKTTPSWVTGCVVPRGIEGPPEPRSSEQRVKGTRPLATTPKHVFFCRRALPVVGRAFFGWTPVGPAVTVGHPKHAQRTGARRHMLSEPESTLPLALLSTFVAPGEKAARADAANRLRQLLEKPAQRPVSETHPSNLPINYCAFSLSLCVVCMHATCCLALSIRSTRSRTFRFTCSTSSRCSTTPTRLSASTLQSSWAHSAQHSSRSCAASSRGYRTRPSALRRRP